jgi:hypothetical protein
MAHETALLTTRRGGRSDADAEATIEAIRDGDGFEPSAGD